MRQVNFEWIKKELFSDESKKIILKKGEVLLKHNQKNEKLFLVSKGRVNGYMVDVELENYPIFEERENNFIGVYSYFAEEHKSYSQVVAGEDTIVYYYDKPYTNHSEAEFNQLSSFFISLVVKELFSRQHFAKRMAKEKYLDTQRLLKAEKLSTLGQMAAGLAHELNNSVGVLSGHMAHLEKFIIGYTATHQNPMLSDCFNVGLHNGQHLSSEDAREAKQQLEAAFKSLSSSQSRRLSRTGIPIKTIKTITHKDINLINDISEFWEMGCAIHDMQIAAKHATHVVKSVKQLGVSKHEWSDQVDVNNTLEEALVILTNITKRVDTTIELDQNLSPTPACAGQLVQVWINIVKNGIESMLQHGTVEPQLKVKSAQTDNQIVVSITDNGPGIPKEVLSKIFQPSFTTKVSGLNFGLGLGLSIVQRIITEHDAQLEVSSEPGNTTFNIKIPLNI